MTWSGWTDDELNDTEVCFAATANSRATSKLRPLDSTDYVVGDRRFGKQIVELVEHIANRSVGSAHEGFVPAFNDAVARQIPSLNEFVDEPGLSNASSTLDDNRDATAPRSGPLQCIYGTVQLV